MNKATVCRSTQLIAHQTARITVITVYITVISSHRLSERLESRSIIRTPHPLKPLNTIALMELLFHRGIDPRGRPTQNTALWYKINNPNTFLAKKKKDSFFFFWLRFLHKKKPSLAEIVVINSCF